MSESIAGFRDGRIPVDGPLNASPEHREWPRLCAFVNNNDDDKHDNNNDDDDDLMIMITNTITLNLMVLITEGLGIRDIFFCNAFFHPQS